MSDMQPPIPGHEKLTMADQMRALAVPATTRTSPVTGAVENPRREFMKSAIAARAGEAAKVGGVGVGKNAGLGAGKTSWK